VNLFTASHGLGSFPNRSYASPVIQGTTVALPGLFFGALNHMLGYTFQTSVYNTVIKVFGSQHVIFCFISVVNSLATLLIPLHNFFNFVVVCLCSRDVTACDVIKSSE